MARVNYSAITKAIKSAIETDADVRAFGATVETHRPVVITQAVPHVGVYELRRDPTAGQYLAAGTMTRYAIQWEIWITCFSADRHGAFEDASAQRDELMGYVEIALMKNRNLGGALTDSSLLLRGGDFRGGPGEGGFYSQAQLIVTAEATATTA